MKETTVSSSGDTVLKDKVAVILGASSGIGAGIAKLLAEQKPKALVLCARRKDMLENLANELSADYSIHAVAKELDATNTDKLKDVLDSTAREYQALDVVIYAAGMIQPETPLEDVELDFRRKIWEVNSKAPADALQFATPHFYRQKSGIFVVISSHAGSNAFPNEEDYCATKAYINQFINAREASLVERRKKGEHTYAFSICPGFINTDEAKKQFPNLLDLVENSPTPEQFAREYILPCILHPQEQLVHGVVRNIKTV
jgi:NADP-dependent 3-hydroxy acid dehydrogenase YdfG